MPQLDIYTYFTQFQWFLVIFTLIFIIINGKFVPTFQSLFVIRNFIGTILDGNSSNNLNASTKTLRSFDYEKGTSTISKISQDNNKIISQWDEIYDKYRAEANKSNAKKASIKVNDSQKPKSIKKKVISKKK